MPIDLFTLLDTDFDPDPGTDIHPKKGIVVIRDIQFESESVQWGHFLYIKLKPSGMESESVLLSEFFVRQCIL